MAMMFLMLVAVLVCVAIVVTYILLNAEDSRWAWVSFLSTGSTALYVYLYSTYFYLFKTNMEGTFQLVYYFGYTGILCVFIFLLCGTIGYTAAYYFVRAIYSRVKHD
jgi:transmembrane 9 superfamily protein 3